MWRGTSPRRRVGYSVDSSSGFACWPEFPELGEKRDDLRSNLRSFSVGNYVIFYFPDAHGVRIVRVIHGARNITALFDFDR
jgi:plasmid stabilization system protein ParE